MSKFASRLTTICFLLAVGYSNSTLHAQTPLKVFVLVGQSNMEGHAKLSTIPHIGMDPNGKAMMSEMIIGWHKSGRILELETKWGVSNTPFAQNMHAKYK